MSDSSFEQNERHQAGTSKRKQTTVKKALRLRRCPTGQRQGRIVPRVRGNIVTAQYSSGDTSKDNTVYYMS